MALTIPNEASATFAPQAAVDSTDFAILGAADGGNGVVSGCAVTAGTGMTVAIAAGTALVGNATVTVNAVASLAIGAAGASDRKDMIVVDNTGTVSVVAGGSSGAVAGVTPAGSRDPVKGSIPANSVVLAEVYVATTTSSIASTNIFDRRMFVLQTVTSVAGRSGTVTLTAADIAAGTFPSGTMTVSGQLNVAGVIAGQSSAGVGDVLLVGNDSKITDINAAHTFAIESQTDTTRGGVQFGSGGPSFLSSGTTLTLTGALTTTGAVSVGGTLSGAGIETLEYGLRAGFLVTGGGTQSFDASSNFGWTARFIVIGVGNSASSSTSGYFDITQPTSGAVTVAGGASARNWSASGIVLNVWDALWYKLPIGSTNASVPGNFLVTNYTSAMTPPSAEYVLLARRNGDDNYLYTCTGHKLSASASTFPAGSIAAAGGVYDAGIRVYSFNNQPSAGNVGAGTFNGNYTFAGGTVTLSSQITGGFGVAPAFINGAVGSTYSVNNTTFAINLVNPNTATSGTTFQGPGALEFAGSYWNGSASTAASTSIGMGVTGSSGTTQMNYVANIHNFNGDLQILSKSAPRGYMGHAALTANYVPAASTANRVVVAGDSITLVAGRRYRAVVRQVASLGAASTTAASAMFMYLNSSSLAQGATPAGTAMITVGYPVGVQSGYGVAGTGETDFTCAASGGDITPGTYFIILASQANQATTAVTWIGNSTTSNRCSGAVEDIGT